MIITTFIPFYAFADNTPSTYPECNVDCTFSGDTICFTKNTKYLYGDDETCVGSYAISYLCDYYNINIANFEHIIFDDTIKAISNSVFYKLDNIETVSMESVLYIDDYAFAGCENLKTVLFSNNLVSIGRAAFQNCKSLESVEFGNKLSSIDSYAFYGCEQLQSVFFSDTDEKLKIEGDAFCGCSSLTSVHLGSKVWTGNIINTFSIGEINSFTVSPSNPYFSTLDGVLFNKDKTKLLLYSAHNSQKSYTIPDCVTSIEGFAFSNGEGVTLTNITIPKSVTSIGYYAFHYCTELTDVYYGGTKEQWEAIRKEQQGHSTLQENPGLNSATIHYTEGNTNDNNSNPQPEKPAADTPATTTVTAAVKINPVKIKSLKKGKKSFTAQWSKANGVDGYQVQYGLKKNFKGAKTKWSKGTKLTVKKLKSKKTYYVRVRAYKKINGKNYYSSWSTKKVKVK